MMTTAAELLVRTFRILFSLLSAAIAVRGLFGYLPDGGIVTGVLEAVTDPLLLPVRTLLDRTGLSAYAPVDLSYPCSVAVLLAASRVCVYLL